MITNQTEQLLPKDEVYKNNVVISSALESAVKNLPQNELGETQTEKEVAIKIIHNWVITLLKGMSFIVKSQNFSESHKGEFQQEFHDKLVIFITNPDHGILHSFFVYKGILHLSNLDRNPIQIGSKQDKEAQLFALLHDAIQVLPFSISKKGRLVNSNHINKHARIMAALIKMFGTQVGFERQTVAEFAFGVQKHDSSYNRVSYPKKLNYIQQLGHDADKIFGASLKSDIPTLTRAMLKRNYAANRGPKGSYLIRPELDKNYRNKIDYGDRCLSDAVSLVRREFTIKMYTQAGKRIAQERRESAMEQIKSVYSCFFDLTEDYITKHVLPNLGKTSSHISMTVVGMDQPESPLDPTPQNRAELLKVFDQLYNTPIPIKNAGEFNSRYNPDTDARGFKIHVLNTETNEDVYLDPSIALFCFVANGRELFLEEITTAFQNGIH